MPCEMPFTRENTDKKVSFFSRLQVNKLGANQISMKLIWLKLTRLMPCQIDMVKIKIGIRQLARPRIDSNSHNYIRT